MLPEHFEAPPFPDHALLDSGGAEKLERFGGVTLRRPDPQALWPRSLPSAEWEKADLAFVRESDRGGRWHKGPRYRNTRGEPEWEVEFGEVRLLCKPTPFKHVGLFPEQATNWQLLRDLRPHFAGPGDGAAKSPQMLNLFGYTGAASIVAARAGYAVTHVDASKTMLGQVRDNQRRSGLDEKAIRVLLEDALKFAKREARRGSRYEVIFLDPPHSGRGPKGEKWQFENDIAPLLQAVSEIAAESALVVLSTYAIGFSPLSLVGLLHPFEGGELDVRELALREEGPAQRLLPAGFCARWTRGLGEG
ncbi:MAG: RsmD family RNA methyltransferase [Planctomycetota bacterium]